MNSFGRSPGEKFVLTDALVVDVVSQFLDCFGFLFISFLFIIGLNYFRKYEILDFSHTCTLDVHVRCFTVISC